MSERILLGMNRPDSPPKSNGAAIIICPCQSALWTTQAVDEHWRLGHFDTPVYATREEMLDKLAEKMAARQPL